VLVGTGTALANVFVSGSAVAPAVQVEGNSGATSALSITRQTGAAANLILQRGITGTPVAVNHLVGQINFNGFDGTNFRTAAQINSAVDGTPGTADMPGRLVFSTTPSGSGTPTERMRLDSSGRLGLGNSSPVSTLHVVGTNTAVGSAGTFYLATSTTATDDGAQITFGNSAARRASIAGRQETIGGSEGYLQFGTRGGSGDVTERMRIDSIGRVGIGTTSPATTLDVNGDVTITDKIIHGGDTNTAIRFPAADTVSVETSGSERARIDSSGRLLVGTSTARSNFYNSTISSRFLIEGANDGNIGRNSAFVYGANNGSGPNIILAKHRSNSIGGTTVVNSGDQLGGIYWLGSDGTEFVESARITADVDGTPGANDMPGRLVFSTTADGSASPTERLRLTSGGNLLVGTTTGSEKLRVAGQVQIGNGTSGSDSNPSPGGGFYRTTGFTAAGTSHTISTFGPNGSNTANSFSGMLVVTARRAGSQGSAVSILAVTKRDAANLSVTEISNKKDNITTFSVTNSSNDILVTTDSDCVVCTSFVGGF
jgi:hypothetical protein